MGIFSPPELMELGLHWGFSQLHYPLIEYRSVVKMNKRKSYTMKITDVTITKFESKAHFEKPNSLNSCLEFSL